VSNLLTLQNDLQEFPLVQSVFDNSLIMPESEIDRYCRPPADTVFPLEYAFHLFGATQGKTIVDLGCGEGLNTIILAGLGAHVFSIDSSEKNLDATCRRASANGVRGNVTLLKSDRTTIPVRDNQADHVLCSSICHYSDPVATARQIRRLLRPGGTVVFNETVYTPLLLALSNSLRPQDSTHPRRFLTPPLVNAISRAVGMGGRRREFSMTVRLLDRLGVSSLSATGMFSHRMDARLLRRFAALRQLASQIVWEARKEK
jgi:SAM-dependent methyltransferase